MPVVSDCVCWRIGPGLTGELSKAVARGPFTPRHDRGWVVVYVAVMLADGGEAKSAPPQQVWTSKRWESQGR